jgi:DNA-binding helix-hairpin-helix protein with protein kinase domain
MPPRKSTPPEAQSSTSAPQASRLRERGKKDEHRFFGICFLLELALLTTAHPFGVAYYCGYLG